MWSQLNIKYGYNLKNDCGNVIATFPARVSPRRPAQARAFPPHNAVPFPGGMRSPPSPSSLVAAVETPSPVAKMRDPDTHQQGFLIVSLCPILLSFEPLRRSHCMFFSANTRATKTSSVTLKAEVLLQSLDSRGRHFMKIKCTGICNTT